VADAVERQLHRHDVRIADGGADERLDRDERVERMVQHVVAVPRQLEDFFGVVAAPHGPRCEVGVLQLGAVQPRQLHPVAKSQPM
jgi:hypothetical protein